jgi:MSHA biogenesis protein MshQ
MRVGTAASTASGRVCRGADIRTNTSNATWAVNTDIDVDTVIGATGGMTFWYRGNVNWGSGNDMQLFDATVSSNRSFHLVRRGNGSLRFAVTDSGGSTLTASSSNFSFAAGTWVHIAAIWKLAAGGNASSLAVYVNGASVATATGTTTGALDASIGTLYVGDSRNNITSNSATVNSADGHFDELRIYSGDLSAADIAADMALTRSCTSSLHHVEIRHASGSSVTCTPSTVTVMACQDAACATPYTGGVTGTLTATGAGMTVNWPTGAAFTIAAGSSSVTENLQLTTVGSVVLGASGLTPSASSTTSCNFGSPSCTFSAADSGFIFDVPNHAAESVQTVSVSAVKKADNSLACVPAFASVSKSVTFKCAYTNPGTGTLPVRVGDSALNSSNNTAAACDGSGRPVSLAFNASGVASTSVQYADVGQLSLAASYAGSGSDAGLAMTGSDSFIAAPASFAFSGITAAPIRAGLAFSATVAARNSAGGTTPNFGRETVAESVTLSFTRRAPTGAGASNGSFSGSAGAFSNGAVTSDNLVWSEVGTGDLSATLASGSYLGSGLTATGTTGSAGAVGRFIPHHFDVTVTPACGAFSYAGQPFNVTVTAKNGLASPGTTLNYDGSAATTPTHAKTVTLLDQPALGLGTLSNGSIAPSAFTGGVAAATPSYDFTTKTTAPQAFALRAVDTDAVSSAGYAEGNTALRSGRLRLASAYGSEKAALAMPVRVEYWSGSAWLTNTADSCTTVPAAAVALSNRRNHQGSSGISWTNTTAAIGITAGVGTLSLGAPAPTASGIVDVALNLGSSSTDQSCLATHPATTGAARAWLRAANGSCAASTDRDPSARASFGIYSPETQRTVHARELY